MLVLLPLISNLFPLHRNYYFRLNMLSHRKINTRAILHLLGQFIRPYTKCLCSAVSILLQSLFAVGGLNIKDLPEINAMI